MREGGRVVGEEVWQEIAYNREEWKKLLRTVRNYHILYMPMKCINECKILLPNELIYCMLNIDIIRF
jgi:hypothetical protein